MSLISDILKLYAGAALAFTGGALAAEAVLVHDIAPPHPRYTQLTQMAAEVAKRTQGTLTIAINPGGKVLYPGQASLDAVRNKTVPLAFINSAFLQAIDADLGFLNLPFTITDQLMAKPGVAEGVLALVRSYVEPRGLKVFALMRGADTIVIFKNRQVRTPDDMKGLKIRVAGRACIRTSSGAWAPRPSFPGDRNGRGPRARRDGRHHHLARRLGQERAGRAEREPRTGVAVLYLFPDRR